MTSIFSSRIRNPDGVENFCRNRLSIPRMDFEESDILSSLDLVNDPASFESNRRNDPFLRIEEFDQEPSEASRKALHLPHFIDDGKIPSRIPELFLPFRLISSNPF